MSSAQVIDALFERTVDIVQSLPKSGPIQTSYEEKLALYSLYKQATEGDVTSKRPGMLDMLGRAKWDHWDKRRGLSSQNAKQLYVESMLRTLRKFSDRPQAIALIEELESFSGDVAQRVMSASLARASTDSESEGDEPLTRAAVAGLDRASSATEDSEDERDALAQLPQPGMPSRGTGAGATGSGGRRTPQSGSATGLAQRYAVPPARSAPRGAGVAERGAGARRAAAAEVSDSESMTDEEEEEQERLEHQRRLQQQQRGGGGGPGRAPPGYYGGPPPARYATPQSWSRGPGSVAGLSQAGGEGRLYAPPGAARQTAPPSESNMQGGAGASLYSAMAPSRPLPHAQQQHGAPPSEQHYYHHSAAPLARSGYAASSVGGRSGGRPTAAAGAVGAPAQPRNEVDQALQAIQASLAALHERINRVEGTGSTSRGTLVSALFGSSGGAAGAGAGAGGRRGALRAAYAAVADALHDITVLFGLRAAARAGAPAPSYALTSAASARGGGASTSGSARGGGNVRGGAKPAGLGAPVRLVVAVLNLSVRLALDITSLALLVSLALLLIQRLTGRGDALLLLKLLRRWRPRRAAAVLGIAGAAVKGKAAEKLQAKD